MMYQSQHFAISSIISESGHKQKNPKTTTGVSYQRIYSNMAKLAGCGVWLLALPAKMQRVNLLEWLGTKQNRCSYANPDCCQIIRAYC
jgi:hypothetical protein